MKHIFLIAIFILPKLAFAGGTDTKPTCADSAGCILSYASYQAVKLSVDSKTIHGFHRGLSMSPVLDGGTDTLAAISAPGTDSGGMVNSNISDKMAMFQVQLPPGGVETNPMICSSPCMAAEPRVPGNDSGGMITIQPLNNLRYLAETETSVVLLINNSGNAVEISDGELSKSKGLSESIRASFETKSWVPVN